MLFSHEDKIQIHKTLHKKNFSQQVMQAQKAQASKLEIAFAQPHTSIPTKAMVSDYRRPTEHLARRRLPKCLARRWDQSLLEKARSRAPHSPEHGVGLRAHRSAEPAEAQSRGTLPCNCGACVGAELSCGWQWQGMGWGRAVADGMMTAWGGQAGGRVRALEVCGGMGEQRGRLGKEDGWG